MVISQIAPQTLAPWWRMNSTNGQSKSSANAAIINHQLDQLVFDGHICVPVLTVCIISKMPKDVNQIMNEDTSSQIRSSRLVFFRPIPTARLHVGHWNRSINLSIRTSLKSDEIFKAWALIFEIGSKLWSQFSPQISDSRKTIQKVVGNFEP